MSSYQDSETDSVASTPRSERHHPPPPLNRWHHHYVDDDDDDPAAPRIRLMCSFGGRILPRPHDHQLRYVGGDTRIVAIPRASSFAALLSKLAKLAAAPRIDVAVKYRLPHEDLDALISVTSDEDVELMMEEYDRLSTHDGGGGGSSTRTPRLRLFLFQSSAAAAATGGFVSLLDGVTGSERDSWFLDFLNGSGGAATATALDPCRSEASSMVSEVPDYLFGLESLDHHSDESMPGDRHVSVTDSESPVPRASLAPSVPPIPSLPPVGTKPYGVDPTPAVNREIPAGEPVRHPAGEPVRHVASYSGSQVWQYVPEPAPVYYVPGPIPPANLGPPVPLHVSYGVPSSTGGQITLGYQHPVRIAVNNLVRDGPVYVEGPLRAPPGMVGPYDFSPPTTQGYNFVWPYG